MARSLWTRQVYSRPSAQDRDVQTEWKVGTSQDFRSITGRLSIAIKTRRWQRQWPRRGSNPHRDFSPKDFKSFVSAIPPLGLFSRGSLITG